MLEFFCRHLIALSLTYHLKAEPESPARFLIFAGTLIILKNTVCLLTAGHILRNLEKIRDSNDVVILGAHLVDTFGAQPRCLHPIPFDLTNAALAYIDDEDDGLDFGLIPLTGTMSDNSQPMVSLRFRRKTGPTSATFALMPT